VSEPPKTNPTSVPETPHHVTWRSPRAWAVLLLFAALGLLTDLGSKSLAFERITGAPVVLRREQVLAVSNPSALIPPHAPVVVVPRLLEFTLVANPGAVFGVGAGKRLVFVGFTFVALAFGLLLFARWTHPGDRPAHAAVGLLIAGGIGNLYDRIVYGCVRDFIHPLPGVVLPGGWEFPWGGREVWPYVSNLADLWLIFAIAILLIRSIWPIKTPPN
jgi:signal peptidase II